MAAQPDVTWRPVDCEATLAARLPQVDPAVAKAVNAFLSARSRCRFCVNQREFELSWDAVAPAAVALWVELSCGVHRLAIALDGLAAVDPLLVGEPFDLLPGALRDLVLQHRLAAFLAALPPIIADGAKLRCVRWDVAEPPQWTCSLSCSLGFVLRRSPDGAQSRGLLATDSAATLLWLHEHVPSAKQADDGVQSRMPMPLRIVLGSSSIEAAQLRDLASGDVVWIEDAAPARKGLKVRVYAAHVGRTWPALLTSAALQITGIFEPYPTDTTDGEVSMSIEPTALEVPVVFDLGTLQIPLDEVERMQPGKTFELSSAATQATVSLRVCGKCLAQGTLVMIGKRLGVRIQQVGTGAAPLGAAS